MHYEQFINIAHETLLSVVLTIGPVLVSALVAGLIVGIFQAATSINEATLTFVPKLVIVIVVLALSAPFMLSTLSGFFATIFSEIGKVGQ
jgi:flagellar biosynthesis protein FliQ